MKTCTLRFLSFLMFVVMASPLWASTNYPGAIDTNTSLGVAIPGQPVNHTHHNNLKDAMIAIQAKVGIDGSANTATLDFLLKSTSSINPGHKHTAASLPANLAYLDALQAWSASQNFAAGLTVGTKFALDLNGNITKLNNVPYSFPAAQGGVGTVLGNNGSGTLTWISNATAPGGVTGAVQFNATTFGGDATNFFWDNTNKRLGLLTNAPTHTFSVAGKLIIDANGNLVKINNVTYAWPASNASGVLSNNGTGTLSWVSALILSTLKAAITDTGGQVYNVKGYGAIGDGVTNDTVALQAASDACKVSGGVIYAPPGTYKHTQFTVASDCILRGAGTGATTFFCDAAEGNVCIHGSQALLATLAHNYGDAVSHVGFEDFTLNANGTARQGANAPPNYVRGLVVAHASSYITIDRVRITDGGSRGLEVNPSAQVKLTNSFCEDSSHVLGREGDCFHIGNPGNNGSREPPGWTGAMSAAACHDILVDGNTIMRVGDTMISVQFCHDITVTNNHGFGDEYFGATPTTDESGVDIFGSGRLIITDNEINKTRNNCVITTSFADASGYVWSPDDITITGNQCYGNLISTNNLATSCGSACIFLNNSNSSCSNDTVRACTVDADCVGPGTCGQFTLIKHAQVDNNYIQDASTEAIRLNAGIVNFSVQNNVVRNAKTCPGNCYQAGGGTVLSANDAVIGVDTGSSQSRMDYGIFAGNVIDVGTGASGVGILFRNSSASARGVHFYGNKIRGQTFSPIRITGPLGADDQLAYIEDWNGDTYVNALTAPGGAGMLSASSGSKFWCSTCGANARVCADGGTGAVAIKIGSVWTCGGAAYQCGSSLFAPMGTSSVPFLGVTSSAVTTVGQLRCGRWTPECDMPSATKLAFRHTAAGAAGSQCSVAVYTADGATKMLDTGVLDCSVAAVDKSVTGLTAASFSAGTSYLVCHASSVAATLAYLSPSGATATLWNTYATFASTTANAAQFNDACTGLNTPYTCCLAADAGTCTGMPSTTGALTNATVAIPIAVIHP